MTRADRRSTTALQSRTATAPCTPGRPGQVAGEVGLEAVDTLDGAGRELGAVAGPPAARPPTRRRLTSSARSADITLPPSAGPQLDHVRQPGPGMMTAARASARPRDLPQAPLGGVGDDPASSVICASSSSARSAGGQVDGQGPPGDRHPAEQPPVEGPEPPARARVLGPRGPASCAGRLSDRFLRAPVPPGGVLLHPPDWMICAGAKPHPNRVMPATRPGGTVAARSP
jgi:hypothetical protein